MRELARWDCGVRWTASQPANATLTWDGLPIRPAIIRRQVRVGPDVALQFSAEGANAMRLHEVYVIAMIIAVLGALLIPGSDFDLTHRFPPTAIVSRDDFSSIAGEYYQGAARGRYLHLSILADGRYSFIWSGCTGVHCRESGYVRSTVGEYEFSPVTGDRPKIDRRLLLVRWQSRRYLVPAEKVQKFCDAVIKGDEPRTDEGPGDFYLALPLVHVDGLPELPDQWARFLGDHVAIGKIIDVTDDGIVKVEFGTAAGIEKGAILKVRPDRRFDDRRLRVESSEHGICLARECSTERNAEALVPGREVIVARVGGEKEHP